MHGVAATIEQDILVGSQPNDGPNRGARQTLWEICVEQVAKGDFWRVQKRHLEVCWHRTLVWLGSNVAY